MEDNAFVIVNHSEIQNFNMYSDNYQYYFNTFKYYMTIISDELSYFIENVNQSSSCPSLFSID